MVNDIMGMMYQYAGSASYLRFKEEMQQLHNLVKGVNSAALDKFFNEPYEYFTSDETKEIYNILCSKPEAKDISSQIMYELKACVEVNDSWYIV